tara:strand:- start:9442 stop:9996 length:555 start_codon:yes stop_codon:yes gene_type:complete
MEDKKTDTKLTAPRPTAREILTAPIRVDEIEWRIGSKSKETVPENKRKTSILAYITNRAVMERLDAAFGWDGWENNFREVTGGFICGIKVLTVQDGEPVWILKEDGAPRSDIEALKGGLSDSMKRTAVQFGIGRDLYNYPKTYMKGLHKWIPDWAKERLEGMVHTMNNDPGIVPPVVIFNPPKT